MVHLMMKRSTPKPIVHIGIVTYNSLADLSMCLKSIRKQTYRNLKVHIVDNASADGTAGWLRQRQQRFATWLSPRNLGFGAAHNRIIQSISFRPWDWYLLLNPDVILESRYLERLLALLIKKKAGWGTGKLYQIGDQKTLYSVGHGVRRDGFAFHIGYGLPDRGQYAKPREIFGAPAAASLIHSRLIQKISADKNLFDPEMFLYCEDVDLDWRARLLGFHCWYCPTAIAYHRGSTPKSSLKIEAIGNRYLSVLKNAYPQDLFWFNLPLILAHCLVRLVVTPRLGFQLTARLIKSGPNVLKKRIRPKLSKQAMERWFRWSQRQRTTAPRSVLDRFKALQTDRFE